MKKLNYFSASYFMAGKFKGIRSEIKGLAQKRNFAGVVQALVNHLKTLQAQGDLKKVINYITYLGKVYSKSNAYVQYMIENLFIRSLDSIGRCGSSLSWHSIYKQMPQSFVLIYQRQLAKN